MYRNRITLYCPRCGHWCIGLYIHDKVIKYRCYECKLIFKKGD